MALLLVLLCTILVFSLASTEQCVSSPDSSVDLTLHSHKNASGHWIITVDTRRLTRKDNPRKFSVNVQHETRMCGRYEIEEHVSMAFAYPSLYDTSIPGTIEPSATTTTAATLSTATATPSNATISTTTTATPPSATISTSTTTTLAPPTATATPSTATISTSTATTATPPNTTTSTSSTTPKSCPSSGYQLYPEFNCYKAFPSRSERRTWSEARDQCIRDGGDLMVMETERERQDVFLPLFNSVSWSSAPWVGVYKQDGWMTVNGEPAPSTWWEPGYPVEDADRKCAFAVSRGLLVNFKCAAIGPFICEISL